jgi:ethanolamine permease
VIGIIYFAVRGRHKLVLSPEEEFAMSHGKRGANLQKEGYGTVSVAEISADVDSASPTPADDSPTRSP